MNYICESTPSPDSGKQNPASSSSSCKDLKFVLDNGEELSSDSNINCTNSPVIKKMVLEDGASTIDVGDYSKDAVLFFIEALTNGSLKSVPPSIFRDVNRLANKF